MGGKLFYKQTKVDTVNIEICLKDFETWLQRFHKPLLVCHNGKVFDSIVFIRNVLKHPDSCLMTTVAGFVDTLHVFRGILPNQPTYKLQNLVYNTMGISFEAHSALEDAKVLQRLVKHHKVAEDTLLNHSFGVEFVRSTILHKAKTVELLDTLKPLESCLSKYMLKKISSSGLSYDHLKLACERGGLEVIEKILGEKTDGGSARITKNKKIIDKMFSHFQ